MSSHSSSSSSQSSPRQHPGLLNHGFSTSTIFTLGTAHGVVLIRAHTTDDDLHLFAAFVNERQHDINLHWASFMPRTDATNITHEAIVVPVDGDTRLFHTTITPRHLHNPEPQPAEGGPSNNSTVATFPSDEVQQPPEEEAESTNSSTSTHVTDSGYHSSASFHLPNIQEVEQED